MKRTLTISVAVVSALGAGTALAGFNDNVSVDYAAHESSLSGGSWDYAYDGVGDAFTGRDNPGSLDGQWIEDQRWDGSAPGEVGDPDADPDSDSPGGLDSLVEGSVDYLRIQDTGDPTDYDPDPINPPDLNWNDPSNRRFNLHHNLGLDGQTILDTGTTFSFRARLASTGTLDDQYLESGGGTAPWPAGGAGTDLNDEARALFGIAQFGGGTLGFSLALSSNTPAGIGGGLVMNNTTGAASVATEDATPGTVNLVPISDTDLLDWHEFWVTVKEKDADEWLVRVWVDGATQSQDFAVAKTLGDFDQPEMVMGKNSGSAIFAADVDFFAWDNSTTTVPEPSSLLLSLLGACGLVWVAVRRRRG